MMGFANDVLNITDCWQHFELMMLGLPQAGVEFGSGLIMNLAFLMCRDT
jgi:hypothetical protein